MQIGDVKRTLANNEKLKNEWIGKIPEKPLRKGIKIFI